ncbi:MAG: hypothetical protein RJQ00_11055 [Vicingaceae bacterium]
MKILRNILAVIVGWLGGSALNMGLIQVGHSIYPIEGLDPNDMESLVEIMPTLSSEYYIFPFLAHALGTLLGALIAAAIAKTSRMKMALIVGAIFLLGGIAVNIMIPGPLWFTFADIIIAYLPMAWLGGVLGQKVIVYKEANIN